jgi:hypothetical protein
MSYLSSTLSSAIIYQAFSGTISFATETAAGVGTTFISITKTPTSAIGSGTSLYYQSLSMNGNDFINTDTIVFGAGVSSINLSGTYTDAMFADQTIKYFDNPTNVKITKKNRAPYYHSTQTWAKVPNPVSFLYSFKPSGSATLNIFNYSITYYYQSGTGYSAYTAIATENILQPISYDIGYETAQFLNVLANQRYVSSGYTG